MKKFKDYLIPSVIASICMSMYAIIDGIFIGLKLSDIGLAAINLAWPITALLQSLGVGLGISSGIYISRKMAKGESDIANKSKLSAILSLALVGLILGTILFVFKREILILFKAEGETLDLATRYIRVILYGSIFQVMGCGMIPLLKNSGRIKSAFLGSIVAIVVNLGLDYLFIFTFDLGLEGAAGASVIAQAASFIACLIPYIKEIKGFNTKWECYKEIFLGGIAPFVLNYSYSFIIIITNALCMIYVGDSAVAAYTLLSYILYIISATAQGTADAIQPLFSYHYEIKEYDKCKKMLKQCLCISLGLVIITAGILLVCTNPLASLYNLSEGSKEIYYKAVPYYFSGFLFVALSKVLSSYFYSINKKIGANIITLSEPLLITPLIYLILSPLKIEGLWMGFLIIQGVLLLIGAIILLCINRKENNNGWIFNNW